MYHPRREMAQLTQVPQIKNGKPDFSPTFQKVELRNSTFFQQSTRRAYAKGFMSVHPSVRPSVRLKVVLKAFYRVLMSLNSWKKVELRNSTF